MRDPIVQKIRTVRKKLDKVLDENPGQFKKDLAGIRKRYSSRIIPAPAQQKVIPTGSLA
jgi:hypothetical protein